VYLDRKWDICWARGREMRRSFLRFTQDRLRLLRMGGGGRASVRDSSRPPGSPCDVPPLTPTRKTWAPCPLRLVKTPAADRPLPRGERAGEFMRRRAASSAPPFHFRGEEFGLGFRIQQEMRMTPGYQVTPPLKRPVTRSRNRPVAQPTNRSIGQSHDSPIPPRP
jgi:hypothetical protein